MTDRHDPLAITRRTLIERLKRWDDEEGWREFFQTYWRLIYTVAVRAGLNDAEAQDVVQETVITVCKNIRNFKYDRSRCTFKTWLLNATGWRIADQLRKRLPAGERPNRATSRTHRTGTLEKIPDPAGFALEAIWEKEWQEYVRDTALERVKTKVRPKQYQIFDLYVIKSWPLAKVTRTLGVSTGQTYLAKHRISRLLREEIRIIEGGLQ